MVNDGDDANTLEDDDIPSHQICLSLIKISMGNTFFMFRNNANQQFQL